jgi:hypothetical protein
VVSLTPRPFYHRSGCFRRRKIYSALLGLQFIALTILSEELKSGNSSLAIFSNVVLLPSKSSSQLSLLKQPQFMFFPHTTAKIRVL